MLDRSQLAPRIGWPLLTLPDADGNLSFPDLAASVRQSIRIILSTRPGEQLMRPGFGAGLSSVLGQPNTVTTRRQIHDLVSGALQQWETRIAVDRIDVQEVVDAPTEVGVQITYRLVRTGVVQQLGLTVDLGS
jgi:phage baseplate assembly protein W